MQYGLVPLKIYLLFKFIINKFLLFHENIVATALQPSLLRVSQKRNIRSEQKLWKLVEIVNKIFKIHKTQRVASRNIGFKQNKRKTKMWFQSIFHWTEMEFTKAKEVLKKKLQQKSSQKKNEFVDKSWFD